MRHALSLMFTPSKTRRMHAHVMSTVDKITQTLRQQILEGHDNIAEAKTIARVYASDVSLGEWHYHS